jgi:transcriptional regulator with XRE-family HTH domain
MSELQEKEKLNVSKDSITDIENYKEKGKNELKQEFIIMRAKGYSYRDIEDKLEVSRTTLSNWSHELEEEIARLKAIELDSLYQQYYLKKKEKIELLGTLLENMKEEALNRDLSDIRTDRLLGLILRYQEKLEDEKVEVKLISDSEMKKLKADKTTTKLDSSVKQEIDNALIRFKTGLINESQFQKEIYALKAKLKAKDQEELERKLDRLENLLERRSG